MKVKFLGEPHLNWGGCADPTGVLEPGAVYDVQRVEARSYHTRYHLSAFPGVYFNSVQFTDVES